MDGRENAYMKQYIRSMAAKSHAGIFASKAVARMR